MKIVILAAGKGTRMGELTKTTPKPLLTYGGENLLENKLKNLPSNATEIILVINYFGDQIKKYFGHSFNNIPITYVEQKETLGTAHALWECRELLNDYFMVLMSDDIYSKDDLEKMSKISENKWAILAYPDKPNVKAGKIVKDETGYFKEFYNDFSGTSPYNLIYTGVCVLTPEVFNRDMVKISNGEYGLPQTFSQFVDKKQIAVLETTNWIRITKPEDLV